MENCAFCNKEREIYGYCSKCNAPLCEECYNATNNHYCFDCSIKECEEERKSCIKNGWINIIDAILWILAVASFFLCFEIYDKTSKMWVPFIGIGAVFLICFYPAWALVRKKIKTGGWIFFIIKLILSTIVMVVSLPIYIYQAIGSFIVAKKYTKLEAELHVYKATIV